MADEQIVTNIVANADFSNLIADVHKVTASLSQLQEKIGSANKTLSNQIAVMNRSFSETMRSTGQYSTHFISLTSDVEKFGRNLDSGKLKLRDYFRTWQEHTKTSGGLIRDLAKQQVQLQNSILQPLGRNAQGLMQFNVHVPRGLDNIKNKAALAKQELQIMNKVIQDGGVQLINWGKNTQWAGRQLTVGLTIPMAAFGKAAADAFKVADQELTRLTKVYGDIAGTSAQELQRVRKEVAQTSKELASAYGVNFQETIGLAADIAATGKQGNELLASVKETTRLAVLGEVDRQDAMKATLAIQSAFKQNTEELSQSINFLNAVENQTSTTLNDLVEAIPKAGPVIKGLGGSVQDLALYLTAMREGGVSASEGANALKSALASLINPTDVAVAKFKSFGIDLLGIVNNNAGNVTGTLLTLQAALDKLDPLQKQQAIEQLFGKFQFSRLNALFENLGKQGSQTLQVLDLMKASSQDLANIAGRELAQVTESASGRYRRAIEGLRADLATVGEQFLNISTNVINFIDKIIGAVDRLPKPVKQALTFVGGLTALAGPLIMLTGVLANFFGYIIKGLGHLKALFKGAEGFKLLTPEILAAQKAGSFMEDTLYSDAKAASILTTAIRNLNDEIGVLQNRISSGQISVKPVLSHAQEMVGNAAAGGLRVVDPSHPLAGDLSKAPRASAHINPRNPGDPATIFGLVPGAEPVNRLIGRTPQIYMTERLPNVEGVTSVGGVSTGIVAGEAARYHALMATLGMQSKQEIEDLKKTIAVGGAVSSDFISTFDDILPITQRLTQNAAQQSAMIVADLRQNKITAEQARSQIIALNAEIEKMMGQEISAYATSTGRTIDLTKAPLINQSVVNTAGKSNLRGMFRKGIFSKVMSAVGRATRTRTYGAPYSIEVTKPAQFRNGVTAVGIQKFANGFTSVKAALGAARYLRAFAARSRMIGGLRSPNLRVGSTSGPSTISAAEAGVGLSFGQIYKRNSKIYTDPEYTAYGLSPTQPGEVLAHGLVPGFLQRTKGLERSGSSPMIPADMFGQFGISSKTSKPYALALPSQFVKTSQLFNDNLKTGTATASMFMQRPATASDMMSLLLFLKDQGVPSYKARIIADRAATVLNQKISSYNGPITEEVFGKFLNNASVRAIASGFKPSMVRVSDPFGYDAHTTNRGLVPNKYQSGVTKLSGYGGGDIVPALLEPGESVLTKEATRDYAPLITAMNARMLPKFQDGVTGVGIKQSFTSGLKNPYGSGLLAGGMRPMGIGSQIMLGLAGAAVGQKVGGGLGTAIMMASNFLPMLSAMKGIGGALPMIQRLSFLLGRLTIPGAVIGGLVLGGKLLLDWKKRAEEAGKANRLVFGATKTSLSEVGLSYTTVEEKLKSINEQLALQKTKGAEAYASLTQSGVPGLTLTIKELADKIKEVKTGAKETVGAFNAIDTSRVADLAASLKQQYVSAGMSVQDATNNIYAMIKASNKGNQALQAITTTAFVSIKDKATAAEYSVSALAKVLSDKNLFNAEEFGRGVDQMLNSIDTYRQSLVGTKDGEKTITEAEALRITLDKIKQIKGANNKLDDAAIRGIQQQNMILGSVLGKAETLSSVYAKMALMQKGFGSSLAQLSPEAAVLVAQGMQEYNDAIQTASKDTEGALAPVAKTYNKLKSAALASANVAKKASAMTSDAIDAEIKKRQKLIDSLEKEKQARLDALDAQQKAADFATSVKEAQIQYQEALAAGDMAQAAQAQLQIQKLTEDRQRELARTAIEDKYNKQIEALQKQIEKFQDAKNAQDKAITGAQNRATTAAEQQAKIESYTGRLAQLAEQNPNVAALSAKDKQALIGSVKSIIAEMKKEGGAIAAAAIELEKKYAVKYAFPGDWVGGKPTPAPAGATELGMISALSQQGMKLAGSGEFKTAVDKFAEYVNKMIGDNRGGFRMASAGEFNANRFREDDSWMTFEKDGARFTILTTSTGYKNRYSDAAKKGYKFVSYSKDAPYDAKKVTALKKADGGFISGPGTDRSDSIPAMLSNGEYVINARAVKNVGLPLLDNINRMADGGYVMNYRMPSISSNPRVRMSDGGLASSSNALYNINVTLNGSNLSPDDVAQAIDRQMRIREAMNGRNRNL